MFLDSSTRLALAHDQQPVPFAVDSRALTLSLCSLVSPRRLCSASRRAAAPRHESEPHVQRDAVGEADATLGTRVQVHDLRMFVVLFVDGCRQCRIHDGVPHNWFGLWPSKARFDRGQLGRRWRRIATGIAGRDRDGTDVEDGVATSGGSPRASSNVVTVTVTTRATSGQSVRTPKKQAVRVLSAAMF